MRVTSQTEGCQLFWFVELVRAFYSADIKIGNEGSFFHKLIIVSRVLWVENSIEKKLINCRGIWNVLNLKS